MVCLKPYSTENLLYCSLMNCGPLSVWQIAGTPYPGKWAFVFTMIVDDLPTCQPQSSWRNDTQLLDSFGCGARRYLDLLSARALRVSVEITLVLLVRSYCIGHRCHKHHTYLVWTFSSLAKTTLHGPYVPVCSILHQNGWHGFS